MNNIKGHIVMEMNLFRRQLLIQGFHSVTMDPEESCLCIIIFR